MHGLRFLFIGWIAAASPAYANPQVFFSSSGDAQRQVIRAIDTSFHSIDVAMFDFTSKPILAALQQASRRGVTVRLLLDSHALPLHVQDLTRPERRNFLLRTLKGRSRHRGVMHNKFAIFDQTRVMTGSYNWTRGAEYANYENLLLEDNATVVQAYTGQFAKLWEKAVLPNEISSPSRRSPDRHIRPHKIRLPRKPWFGPA